MFFDRLAVFQRQDRPTLFCSFEQHFDHLKDNLLNRGRYGNPNPGFSQQISPEAQARRSQVAFPPRFGAATRAVQARASSSATSRIFTTALAYESNSPLIVWSLPIRINCTSSFSTKCWMTS